MLLSVSSLQLEDLSRPCSPLDDLSRPCSPHSPNPQSGQPSPRVKTPRTPIFSARGWRPFKPGYSHKPSLQVTGHRHLSTRLICRQALMSQCCLGGCRKTAGDTGCTHIILRLELIIYLDQATNWQMKAPWAATTCQ